MAFYTWGRILNEFVGRSFDQVSYFLAGFASSKFAREVRPFEENVKNFYRGMVYEDLCV